MPINSVSTYGSLQSFINNMNTTQSQLNTVETQIDSGEISQTFDGLNGNVEQFISLNAQQARLQNYQQNNTSLLGQLDSTQTVMGSIVNLAQKIQSNIATQISQPPSTLDSFISTMQGELSTLAGLLNTSYAGSYIFGGTRTDVQPVKTPVPNPATPGQPDTTYYQGSLNTTSVQISDTQQISNSITAADPSFQNLIAGLTLAIKAATDASNSTSGTSISATLGNAENLVSSGVNGATALQSIVGNNIVTVNNTNSEQSATQTYLQGITNNMSQSNVVQLSTSAANDQATLEAGMSLYAKISSLLQTLAQYLS